MLSVSCVLVHAVLRFVTTVIQIDASSVSPVFFLSFCSSQNSGGSSSPESPKLDTQLSPHSLNSPTEGFQASSSDNLTKLPEDSDSSSDAVIKEESSTPATSGNIPSPASSHSETSFPKISEVYQATEEQFQIAESLSSEAQSVVVSPAVPETKFFPETSPNPEYPTTTSVESSSGYYVSYTNPMYPSSNYSTSSFPGHSSDVYTNSCISPTYMNYQAGKSYPWPTTPNGVGYSAFGMTPSSADVYQYQAQSAAYQQMASRGSYPGYFAGQTTPSVAASVVPHTMA